MRFPPFLFLMAVPLALAAEQIYTLDLPGPAAPVRRGELDLGGAGPNGHRIDVNNRYVESDGRPFFPIVGEFHYARYPAAQWDEAVRALRAGGINVVATYVFWNFHERREGQFDWSGDLDLRRFIETCARDHLQVIVRLGPFCHGEVRNGGLPDWLYGRALEVRSNDPAYLACVDRLYGQIAQQLRGLLFKDGGPVIGVQLENEYQHSAAPWEMAYPGAPLELTVAGRDAAIAHVQITANQDPNRHVGEGLDHMAMLKRIARQHGLDVPLYTATGWGHATIVGDGSIPVTAAYPYPFWAPRAPSNFYLFKDLRREPDYGPVSYDPDRYPSIAAELGAGIQPTYARRPVVPPESLAPLIVRTVGSGSNGIGYYMYHGGANPVFDGRFVNEQSGGLARINYDYQAPIGEYGQMRPHFRSLRLLHYFLQSFGDRLAPLPTILPDRPALTPTNTDALRYAVRADGEGGFVFLHNFQDQVEMKDLAGLRLRLRARGATVAEFPQAGTFTLRRGATAILPFHLDLAGQMVRSATVQPLTILRRADGAHFVFVSIDGLAPELVFEGRIAFSGPDAVVTPDGDVTIVRGPADHPFSFSAGDHHYLVVPEPRARTALRGDDERLYFVDADAMPAKDGLELRSIGRPTFEVAVYPAGPLSLQIDGGAIVAAGSNAPELSAWRVSFLEIKPDVAIARSSDRGRIVSLRQGLQGASDVWLRVPYVGDRAMAFIGGELVDDHFYQGAPWEISLRKFEARLAHEDLVLKFIPVERTATFLQDLAPEALPRFSEGEKNFLRIDDIEVVPEYRGLLSSGE